MRRCDNFGMWFCNTTLTGNGTEQYIAGAAQLRFVYSYRCTSVTVPLWRSLSVFTSVSLVYCCPAVY